MCLLSVFFFLVSLLSTLSYGFVYKYTRTSHTRISKLNMGDPGTRDYVDELPRLAELAKEVGGPRAYHTLESLCICFPGRISGSHSLECALNYLMQYAKKSVNETEVACTEEVVTCVPCWDRGVGESCTIEIIPDPVAFPQPYPLERQIRILANGLSIGTPMPEGITGEVVIVHDWDQLDTLGAQGKIQGKIVLYDYKRFITYGSVSSFRRVGAERAAAYGAIGVLIRSATPNDSTSGPHTGSQVPHTDESSTVPAACAAVEDVEMLRRLSERGHSLKATMKLPCTRGPDTTSRNLVFEIKGTEKPEEIVIVGGHTDSWDCQFAGCQGAHDDGQGVVVALETIRILHEAGLRPKRTIRAVLFVDEEVTQSGAIAYMQAHRHEAENIVAAMETDLGAGPVCGFGFSGSEKGRETLRELLRPLAALGDVANVDDRWEGKGVDITPLIDECGVPGLLLRHQDSWWFNDYFHLHHTNSDTIDHVDADLLTMNLQVVLSAVWILANADERIPR